MRSLKWLSNVFQTSKASFSSCNFATKPTRVPKTCNKLTYKKPNRPQSKLCSSNSKDVRKQTKNAKLPKVKPDIQSNKFSPYVQLSTRDIKPIRVKRLHDFKEIVKPYNSKKNTQEVLAKIVNIQRVNEPATKTFVTGSFKPPESGPKDSLKSKTERGLKNIGGILKEANDIRYKLNVKREKTNRAKTAVDNDQTMLKYDKKIEKHIRLFTNQHKVDNTAVSSMTYVRPTSDKSKAKNYPSKNTEGPLKSINLTSQMKYDINKGKEVSAIKKNPYNLFQPTVSSMIKDAKLKMWSPFNQPTVVKQQHLKKEPIQIRIIPKPGEENLFNNLDGMIGENIKTFPKKVLKYNLKTEESEENNNPGEVINNETIIPNDDLLENNETSSTKDKHSKVVLNPKYLEDVKNKFFTNKERVVMAAPLKNPSKSTNKKDMTREMERKIQQKNKVKVLPEKNALVESWKSSRMTLPGSTKKKNIVKFRRIRPATPSTASQLLKHADRSPKKITYAKKSNTNANGIIKIPMTIVPVEDCSSETLPVPGVDEDYVNSFNYLKTKIHKQFNDNYKWSPYTKNRNRKSFYSDKSQGGAIHINSATTNVPEDENEFDSDCDDDITSPSDSKDDENRVWVSEIYKKKTTPVVSTLSCSRKINAPSTKKNQPLFRVQQLAFKIPVKALKPKPIKSEALVLGKKTKNDGSKYPNIRDYRNNGDKCPLATKLPKKTKPANTFLQTENAEKKVVTVKVLTCPDMKNGSTSEVQRDQEWSILPADMENDWKTYQKSKSRSDLTNSSDQTLTEETSKPATTAEPNVINKHSTEAKFFNVLLSRSLSNSGVIDLAQTPNPEPTTVKLISGNHHNEKGPVFSPVYSQRRKKENPLDLRKLFARDKQTPSSDMQSTELEAEDLDEPHQLLEDYYSDFDDTAEDKEENHYDDEDTEENHNDDDKVTDDNSELVQNKSIPVVVQEVVTTETTDTVANNEPEQSEEPRWTQQMEIAKLHQQPSSKPKTTTFPIANLRRAPRASSAKGVVVLKQNDIPIDAKNVSYAVTTRKNKLFPPKVIF